MLFKEFVLHNYGIYRDRHVVDLQPHNGKPVILFGALNGSGKTTFLDGLQLALYGKQARCSDRGNLAYHDFLRNSINRYAPPHEGAGLELEFLHHHEGRWQTIRVQRSWVVKGDTVKEHLEVYKDKILDSVLSNHWAEYVEDFIPSQISELFFFDGEKIEALAEENSASAIIRTGIHALLGLDVVDRLAADLKVMQRRRKTEELSAEEQLKEKEKRTELENLSQRLNALTQEIASQQVVIDQLERAVKEHETSYRLEGGELAEQAVALRASLKQAEEEKARHDLRLVELAAGAAPLMQAQALLMSAKKQVQKEQETKRAQLLLGELEARDEIVLQALKEAEVSSLQQQSVAQKLLQDRESRADLAKQPIFLNLPIDTYARFDESYFAQLRAEIDKELEISKGLSEQVHHFERTIAQIPSAEMLQPFKDALDQSIKELLQEQGKMLYLIEQQNEANNLYARLERELQILLEHTAQARFQSETNRRVLKHIDRVDETLKLYRQAILAKNLSRLSQLILESFQKITRKQNVFARIEIAAKDYRLSLYDREDKLIPSSQLSAGERQLLAISILWGLSQASGRPLPAIIDTPLGRLDGEHRSKLVNHYFPNASHQVILLSTDEEINANLYPQIKKSVSQEYLISFDEQALTSRITEGYFQFKGVWA